MSEGHARLGCSNKRWPVCAGSVREEEQYPDVAGEAAIDGTGSHLLLEMCLDNNVPAAQYDQQIIGANHPDNMNGWLVAPDRIKRVQMALDYIKRRVAELKEMFPGCNVLVESETKSDPGGAFGRTDWWGTCDITITARHPMSGEVYFIEVADYKDGRGFVSEKDNSQNISYLFGKMRPHVASGPELVRPFNQNNIKGCRMTIIQPKTNPVIRYQCSTRFEDGISVGTVIEAAEKLAWAAHKTDEADAPLVAGKHCQWCKANPKRGGHCTAEVNQSLLTVESMNTEISTGDGQDLLSVIGQAIADPKSLTVNQLSELASAEAGFQAAFNKVKTEIEERIDQGESVPGYAKVPGRGSKIWNEAEDIIAKKLKSRRLKNDDIYPKKLISPAAMMKLEQLTDDQKARIEKELVSFKAGKMTLKQVAHDHKAEKVVDQSSTSDVQSSEVELMFAGVPKQETAEVVEEVTFL
jgi:hypothetical protein